MINKDDHLKLLYLATVTDKDLSEIDLYTQTNDIFNPVHPHY